MLKRMLKKKLKPSVGGAGETCGRGQASTASSAACSVRRPSFVLMRPQSQANFESPDIGMLVALKSWPELGAHVRGAVHNGLSELEIREALVQATVYCGAPAGLEAFRVAEAVLNDMVAKGEHSRTLGGLSPDAGDVAGEASGGGKSV